MRSSPRPLERQIAVAKILYIRLLNAFFPRSSAVLFSSLWFNVTKARENPKRADWVAQATTHQIPHRQRTIPAYVRKNKAARGQVILLHGWSGRWDQLLPLGEALYDQGFDIVFFDLPAHGENAGNQSDVFEFSEFLGGLSSTLDLRDPIVVCHSAGFLAAAHAKLTGALVPSMLVTIGAPAKFDYLIEVFSKKLNFSSRMVSELWTLVDKRVGVPNAQAQLRTLHMSDLPAKNVLIIHDVNDKEVEFGQTEGLKEIWPTAKILQTRGLGHLRILSDPRVIEDISTFCSRDPKERAE